MGDAFFSVDWHGIFVPVNSVLEMLLRGTVMYAVLFGAMRFVLKRQAGGVGTTDLLVIVLVAEVSGNAFSAAYESVTEGALLVGTILFWSYLLEWLAQRSPAFERLVHPPSLLLIEDGRFLRRNMRAELVTEEELMGQLREHGIDHVAKVKRACMEANGMISVIQVDGVG